MKDHPNTYRCPWVPLDKQEYVDYHDKEWGVPVHDDRLIFEFLTLESAQAGLSYLIDNLLISRQNRCIDALKGPFRWNIV